MFMLSDKVLVTGANGFVGKALCAELQRRGRHVRAVVRTGNANLGAAEMMMVASIDGSTDWTKELRDVDIVIHLAARVHVMKETAASHLAEFLETNSYGTANLARQAAEAGVKRFVYASSIKVNGEMTIAEQPFMESSQPAPQDPYAISKWEAEQELRKISGITGLEVVILRLPLVYGPGVKGNFASMLSVLSRSIPLPLASVRNKRDLIYVGNLVDSLIACSMHPSARGKTYLVCDGEAISTPELLSRLACALGVPSHLFPFPRALLRLAGRIAGKSAQVERLLGSLQVDSGKIRRELNWTPPYTLQQGLQATAEWYRNSRL